jgi:cell division septation protein DedD
MGSRSFASMRIVGILVAVVVVSSQFVTAQAPTSVRKTGQPAKTYTAPRTPDGQPDLQGYWSNTTYTPLQRPNNVTKQFYTKEEAEEALRRAAATENEQTEPGTIPDVHYDFTQFGLDRSQSALALDLRTSLIVDPPDGKLPPLSAEGQRRAAERAEARKKMGGPFDAAQNQSLSVRCINMDRDGPPMLAGAYNNNYEIVQAPGYVLILVEMLHDVRIIPLDKRPPLPENIHQVTGSSRGRWEGETLVVETTNFTNRTAFQGSSEKMRLVERFTRVADDAIRYQFTVEDPATWTRPWSAEVPWKKSVGPIFEHACHEGNYGLANTLAGARAEEKRTTR